MLRTPSVAFINTGGVPVDKKDNKSKIIEENIRDIGASVIGLQETNINWTKLDITDRLQERLYGWWRRFRLNIAHFADYIPKKFRRSVAHQWGGVAQISINDGAARIHSAGQDPTGLGRWAWTRYQGKDRHGLHVVVGYRCNPASTYAGSVYNQQKAYLLSKDDDRCPRDAFWEDLVAEITPWMQGPNGKDHIVVGIDTNDDVRIPSNVKLLRELGLTEVITHKHVIDGPRTCDKGSAPIDGIFVTAGLMESPCGYCPFVFDHRMLWIDLDISFIFGIDADISPRYVPNRLKNDDRRTREHYLATLSKLLCEESDFVLRLDTLSRNITQGSPLTAAQAAELEDLLQIHLAAAKQAEKCCRKLFNGHQAWTPAFTKNRNTRSGSGCLPSGGVDMSTASISNDWRKRQGYRLPYGNSGKQMQLQESRPPMQETFLQAWAAAEAKALRISQEEAIKKRLREEAERRNNRIIARAQGKDHSGGVSKVLVDTPTGIHECISKVETEEALLSESNARFRQAANTPPLTVLFPHLGLMGITDDSDKILLGTFQPPEATSFWTKQWLLEMQRPPNYSAMSIDRTFEDLDQGKRSDVGEPIRITISPLQSPYISRRVICYRLQTCLDSSSDRGIPSSLAAGYERMDLEKARRISCFENADNSPV